MLSDSSLVVVATGSGASIVLPSYLQEIGTRTECDVTVVLSASALRFVRPEVVGWFATRVIGPDESGINPVEVAIRARAIAVLPASGNVVATAALGLMNSTASTVIGASPRPCMFFPQMHEVVWRKSVMQSHISALRTAGHVVVEPALDSGYDISRREVTMGLSMPAPDRAADLIREWLDT